MGDNDDLLVGIVLDDLCRPGEGSIARIEFQGQDEIGLSVDRDYAKKILIAARRITPFPIAGTRIPRGAKISIEVFCRRSTACWIVCVVIVIPNRREIGNVSRVEQLIRSICIVPLRNGSASVHNVA